MKTVRNACIALNKALDVDSDALTALFSIRVACKPELGQKTPFKCKNRTLDNGHTSSDISVLELIQGLFEEKGLKYELNAQRKIKSFTVDNPYGL